VGADKRRERWLDAAAEMRRLARAANRDAAESSDPQAAARYERLAEIHLGSGACFEAAASAAAGVPHDSQKRLVQAAVSRARAMLAERQAMRA